MNYPGEAAERVIGRVGFRGNPQARRMPQGQRGEGVDNPIDSYSCNSGLSAPGTTNLLPAGPGPDQRGGGEKIRVGTNLGGTTPDGDRATSPTRLTTTKRHRHPQQCHGNGGGGATKVQ